MMTPSPANLSYFLNSSAENYYGIQNEPNGYWIGSGCETLKLYGTASEKQIANLSAGYSPNGEKALVQIQGYKGRERQPGWDLTFNAPKSVSIKWALAEPSQREEISRLHADAIGEAVDFLEENGAFSRRKKDNHMFLDRSKIIAVGFEHASSRNLDPHLHTHVVVMNVGMRSDSSTGTIMSRPFWSLQKAAGAIYRVSLSNKIKAAELDSICKGKSSFELESVSQKSIDYWSSRRKEIEAKAKELGVSSLKGLDLITYQTRNEKSSIGRAELFEFWKAVAREQGFRLTPAIDETISQKQTDLLAFDAVAESISLLEKRQSYFSYDHLLTESLCRIEHIGLPVDSIKNAIQSAAVDGRLTHLGTHHEKSFYSTPYLLEIEKRLAYVSDELGDKVRVHRVDRNEIVQTISNAITKNFQDAQKSLIINLTAAGASESSKSFGTESVTISSFLNSPGDYVGFNLLVQNTSSFTNQHLLSLLEYARDSKTNIDFFDRQKSVRFFGAKGGLDLISNSKNYSSAVGEESDNRSVEVDIQSFVQFENALAKLLVQWDQANDSLAEKIIVVNDNQVVKLINSVCQQQLNQSRIQRNPVVLGSEEKAFSGDLIRFSVNLAEFGIQAGESCELEGVSFIDRRIMVRRNNECVHLPTRLLRFAELGFATTEYQLRETEKAPKFVLLDLNRFQQRQFEADDSSKVFTYRSSRNHNGNKKSSEKVDILELLQREQIRESESATRMKNQLQQGL